MHAARVGGFARRQTSHVSNSSGKKLFNLTSRFASASSNPALSGSAIHFSLVIIRCGGLITSVWRVSSSEDEVSTESDSDRVRPNARLHLPEIVTRSLSL